MTIDQNDIDIDNFIKEKINSRRFGDLTIEPSPDFAERTIGKICRIEKRRCTFIRHGSITLAALAPLVLKQSWLFIRNDYFSLSSFPLGNLVVPTYRFVISFSGSLLLIAVGISFSTFFVLRTRHNELGGVGGEAKSVKIA